MTSLIQPFGVLLYLATYSGSVLSLGSPCAYEVCQCSNSNIDCSNTDLDSLPPLKRGIFTQTRLDVSNTNITTIKDGQLPPGLETFVSHNTPLSSIEINSFNDSSATLHTLDIQDSQLDHLPWELMELSVLRTLTLSGNPITQWNPSILAALGRTVETLTLDRMGFTHMPDWIGRFHNIKTMNIRHNSMPTLGLTSLLTLDGDFSFPNLESIDLSFNEIENIDDLNIFRLSKTLSKIVLSNNKIDNIDVLFSFDDIEYLDLYHNQICNSSQISYALYPHRETLTYLRLENNCLTSIPDLSHMIKLQTLILDYNQIVDSPTASLPNSLHELQLYSNSLTEIPLTVSTLTNLTVLMVARNRIQSVDSFIFPSSLQSLILYYNQIENITSISCFENKCDLTLFYIHNNPIKSISPGAFNQMTKLTGLQLYQTKLTRLPLALHSLTKLTYLDLRSIPSLTCTCEESSLATWYHDVTSLRIETGSDCDGVTVDFFLGHLAQNCP